MITNRRLLNNRVELVLIHDLELGGYMLATDYYCSGLLKHVHLDNELVYTLFDALEYFNEFKLDWAMESREY